MMRSINHGLLSKDVTYWIIDGERRELDKCWQNINHHRSLSPFWEQQNIHRFTPCNECWTWQGFGGNLKSIYLSIYKRIWQNYSEWGLRCYHFFQGQIWKYFEKVVQSWGFLSKFCVEARIAVVEMEVINISGLKMLVRTDDWGGFLLTLFIRLNKLA